MHWVVCKKLNEETLTDLFELWNNSYPASLNHPNLEHFKEYVRGLYKCQHTLLYEDESAAKPIAWMWVFQREQLQWFAMIIDENHRKKGLGRLLLISAQKTFERIHGWVIDHDKGVLRDGRPYASPLSFYKKLGFEVIEKQRLQNERIDAVLIRYINED